MYSYKLTISQYVGVQALIAAIPIIMAALIWKDIPSTLPYHWSLSGKADAFASKQIVIFLFPLSSLIVGFVLFSLNRLQKIPANVVDSSKKIYTYSNTFISALSISMLVELTWSVAGIVPHVVVTGLAGLLMLLGNIMLTVEQNPLVGIRFPWTMKSETAWKKTNSSAGALMIAFAGLLIILQFFLSPKVILMFVAPSVLALILIWSTIYSYRVYKQQNY